MNLSKEQLIEKVVSDFLEENIFEDLLEKLDVTPAEAMTVLIDSGHVNPERLKEFLLSDLD